MNKNAGIHIYTDKLCIASAKSKDCFTVVDLKTHVILSVTVYL